MVESDVLARRSCEQQPRRVRLGILRYRLAQDLPVDYSFRFLSLRFGSSSCTIYTNIVSGTLVLIMEWKHNFSTLYRL